MVSFHDILPLQNMKENITDSGQYSPVCRDNEILLINLTKFTPTNDSELDDVDPYEEIVRMMQLIARPPIIVLGTIGNLLTFFTMQRGSLKHVSTCFYMTILGLADTGEFH